MLDISEYFLNENMTSILFWNTNKKNLVEEIAEICHENEIDILVLAESGSPEVRLLEALNVGRRTKYIAPFNPSSRLSFFIKFPPESFRPITDDGGIAIREISPPIGCDFILVAVHLPSKLYRPQDDQTFYSVRIAQTIQEAEKRVGHSKTLVIGDLNMNPFEPGVIGADGLHAVMDKRIASKQHRRVQGINRPFFYNPMWGRMGDSSIGPPGTYYYNSGQHVNYFWNTFDQVLLRPELLNSFSFENLNVITAVGSKKLLSDEGISNDYSDHLPLMISLHLERINRDE